MMEVLRNIYFSMPVRLLLIAFKKHQFMLFFWVLLFAVVIGRAGASVGAPYLFLDPEYLNNVGYLSFSIVGIGFGSLFVTWNLIGYMLNSHRFKFMASLQFPMMMFFINNSIIPIIFLGGYLTNVVRFQSDYEFQSASQIALELLGFFAGLALVVLVTGIYFQITNLRTRKQEALHNSKSVNKHLKRLERNESLAMNEKWRVDYYVTNHLRIRHTRLVDHYDDLLRNFVYRTHHSNALVAQVATIAIMLGIGFFIENPLFQIPAAASSFFFCSMLLSLFGMFVYWTGGWGSTAIVAFLIGVNIITQFDFFGYKTTAYGLNYTVEKAPYTLAHLREISTNEKIERDKKYFAQILNNWRAKNTDSKHPFRKPKLVFINVSGGGLRSALFVTSVLQRADSLLGGKLFDKTFLISGASGGMMGATYLREMFARKQNGFPVNMQDSSYRFNVSKDLLNPMFLTILSNDLFLAVHRFQLDSLTYFKDRGYMYEKTFARNTDMQWEKKISDYRADELSAKIPLAIWHTAITNDSRRYFITPHPCSFLMRPNGRYAMDNYYEIDGIDFCEFFKEQGGENLLVSSAMRMDATFPFILPNPELPSEPVTYVMDGGALDNFGVETTFRFLQAFKKWINENTSGVVIIQTRDSQKQEDLRPTKRRTVASRLFDPLGTVYTNMENMQDFFTDQKLNYMDEELRGKLQFILFEYTTDKEEDKAAMSFHLTARDKRDVVRSLSRPNNVQAFQQLQKALEH